VVVMQYVCMVAVGVPRFSWRHVGLREAMRVGLALAMASAALLLLRLVLPLFFSRTGPAQYLMLPLGVNFIDLALSVLGVLGVRVARRLWTEVGESRRRGRPVDAVPTLLIGAGSAGVLVAKEIAARPDLGIHPVGFVDDDPAKRGVEIHGLRVLGATDRLTALVERHEVKQAIITIANAPGRAIRRIREACEQAGVPAKIIPGIYEILDGRVNLARLREVSIEDLLRREVVELERTRAAAFIAGRRVLVTGAGGSIGAELCRQIARLGPASLVLVERSEPSLFAIHHELCTEVPALAPVPCVCDVTDPERVARVLEQHRPEIVFHAAAHKHVPMMEWNPGEAIKNNALGTRLLADAADRFGVRDFVLISTDKAVRPSSIMGATKRLAEMYVQALARRSVTNYVAVRFGNVLGSAGSVVPIFKEQIRLGRPVTVTHPEMTRYFMTIPEAAELVLQAAALAERGEIFVLDMGEPVRILDLALDLIRLSGLEPYEDVPIHWSGVRPGEKLFEELCFDPDTMDTTRHPKIFVVTLPPDPWERVAAAYDRLQPLVDERVHARIRAELRAVVPDMQDDASSGPVPTGVGEDAAPSSAPDLEAATPRDGGAGDVERPQVATPLLQGRGPESPVVVPGK
jgi:FlaA1/EpsC-like NDP-sugar epimerase